MINQRTTLQATAALWVLLATTWVPGVRAEPCGDFNITSSYDMPANELCLARYRTPNCRKFVDTFNLMDLPSDFHQFREGAGKPQNLVVTGTQFIYNRVMYPGIHVSWSNPGSGVEKKQLIGFLLIWNAIGSKDRYCQVFLLNYHNDSALGHNLRYNFDIPKVEDNVQLDVQLYCIPVPPIMKREHPDFMEKATIFTPKARYVTKDGIEPAKWSPYMAVKTFKTGIIEIRFNHPPTYMQLFFYQIAMFKENDPAHPLYDYQYAIPTNLNRLYQGTQQFKVTSTDCYIIMIWVLERPESRMVPGECGCWALDPDGQKKCENICGSSQIRVCVQYRPGMIRRVDEVAGRVTVVAKAPEQENQEVNKVVQPEHVSTFTIAASILGIVMIVALVVLMGLVVVFSFFKH